MGDNIPASINMKGESSLGFRKGAWTSEEDELLKQCIDKYGVGNWHKVPQRAGLERCRKSCRMRWLNYLKPDINNGEFTEDEVDLIFRLHKLLGNRWSLIAGRLPGRTANCVKNFWNSQLRKRAYPDEKYNMNLDNNDQQNNRGIKFNIIKPRPGTLSKHFRLVNNINPTIQETIGTQPPENHETELSPVLVQESRWEESLTNDIIWKEVIDNSPMPWSEGETLPKFSIEEFEPGREQEPTINGEDYKNYFWVDSTMDIDLWGFLNEGKEL